MANSSTTKSVAEMSVEQRLAYYRAAAKAAAPAKAAPRVLVSESIGRSVAGFMNGFSIAKQAYKDNRF